MTTADHPSPIHADRRTVDKLALALFEELRHRSLVDQRLVHQALARSLGLPLAQDQVAALDALEACAMDIRRAVSRERYRVWQAEQPPEDERPTAYDVEQAFGGWAAVRAALSGASQLDVAAKRFTQLGPKRETQELIAGIRLWNARQPDAALRFARFADWARRYLHEGPAEPGVAVAVSCNTYIRKFGSWFEAVNAAGLLESASFETFSRLASTKKTYTDDELLDAVRAASRWAQREYGRELVRELLDAYREAALHANFAAGTREAVPGATTIVARFGSLPAAMLAAGVIDEHEASRRRCRRGVELTEGELRRYVLKAVAVHAPTSRKRSTSTSVEI